MTDLVLPALKPTDPPTEIPPVSATPLPAAAGWQVATRSSLREVEDLLDWLEAHGFARREVVALQDGLFAVRWR
jgi:hypothetical protein